MQVEFSLNLPDTVQVTSKDVEMITVYALFEKGILTSGQAAEVLGLSKRAFLESASLFGVSVFQYEKDDLTQELEQWQ